MRIPRPALVALVALVVLLGSISAQADEIHHLTLLLSSDLDGALAQARCDGTRLAGRHVGHLAASLALGRAQAESDGRTVAAAIDLGDFSGPAALGRYLLGSPGGPDRLAAFVSRLGFTHAIMGNNFLDRGADVDGILARALPEVGVRLLNATVTCEKREDCDDLASVPPRDAVTANGVKIAIIGATGENVLATIDPVVRAGLDVKPLADTLTEQAKAARAEGAQLVVAAVHIVGGPMGFSVLSTLIRNVDGVDLVVANQLGEMGEAAATLLPPNGAALAASGDSATSAVRVDLDIVTDDRGAHVLTLTSRRVAAEAPEPRLDADMRDLVGEYCAALDRPLPARALKPISVADFLPFVLDSMRRASDSEVAVINEQAADKEAFPLEGAVSAADVFAALPYDDVVVRAQVLGSRLRSMFKAPPGPVRKRLLWAGITEKDGSVLVNDRPLDDASKYVVAMPDYLARGGDAAIGDALEYEALHQGREALQLRDLVIQVLSDEDTGTRALAGEIPLDLGGKLRWTWSTGLTLSGASTRRTNEGSYEDPRLKKDEASAIRGEATGRADADARDHSMRLSARARYAKTAVSPTPPVETEDQLYLEALYRLRAVKRIASDAWWAPVPYAATTMDTEFVKNPSAPFRHEEMGATIGVRLQPLRPLEVKFGVGARRELLDPTGRTRFGLETGYELPRFSPTKVRGLPVDLESGLDYFVSDLAGIPQHEGRLRAKLTLPLGGPLAVAAGLDVLALRTGDKPFAVLSDATLGITARFDGARQQF